MASPQQFYIMHCAKPDSVMNAAGFSVRAASTTDAASLRTAFELPAYELPMDLWAKRPNRTEAPRRLARLAGGWLVHSSYLEKDTTNRDRSYFTHALQNPTADLPAVLRSWGGPAWVTDYPTGADKTLPAPKALAAGPFINDAAVTAFLGSSPPAPCNFDVQTQPARLQCDRKPILEKFLTAILRATEQPEGGRNRAYVHAEPGLVALLLYAAARLLPESIVKDLTFSTFEPAHRGFREFKLATVVGTYLGHPLKWLEPEFTTVRGFGLDTFHLQYSSPELAAQMPGVPQLIALAAAGQWNTLDTVKALVGPNREGLARIATAIDLTQAIERLDANRPTPDDLVRLARDPGGAVQLQARDARVWPHVRKYALAHPALLEAFAPWCAVPERALGFRNAAVEALKAGDIAGCQVNWNVILRSHPPAAVAEHLNEVLRSPKGTLENLAPACRAWLRRECSERLGTLSKEVLPLLRPRDEAEFDAILGETQLPAAWRSTTLLVLLRKSESREVPPALRKRAAAQLTKAPPDVLAAYCASAFDNAVKNPELWESLELAVPPIALFDRLSAAGEAMPPKRWRTLFDALQPFAPAADPQWKLNGRHARWLQVVGAAPEGHALWQHAMAPLDGRFFRGDYSQDAEWAEVQHSYQSLGAASVGLPDDVRLKLWAYPLLRHALHDPTTLQAVGAADFHRAFQAFGCAGPAQALPDIYVGVYGAPSPMSDPVRLAQFHALFTVAYPVDVSSFRGMNTPLDVWLSVSQLCPDPVRDSFQTFFFRHSLPSDQWAMMLAQNGNPALRPHLRGALLAESHQAALNAPDPFDVAPEPPENGGDGEPIREKKKPKPKKQDKSMLPILGGIGLLVVTIVVLLIVAWPKIQKALK